MVAALGVQSEMAVHRCSAVAFSLLRLAGALRFLAEPCTTAYLRITSTCFVVVVIGGLGSITAPLSPRCCVGTQCVRHPDLSEDFHPPGVLVMAA